MGAFSRSNGGGCDKCCRTITAGDINSGGNDSNGNPAPATISRDYCYDGATNVTITQAGPTLGQTIADLFGLSSGCANDLAKAIDNETQQLIDQADNSIAGNPNLDCPPGSCRQVEFTIIPAGGNRPNGSFEFCCECDAGAGGGSGGIGAGISLGIGNVGGCS